MIPVFGGEAVNDEMNAFMRSHRIVNVEKQFFTTADSGYWCFCVNYLEYGKTNATTNSQPGKQKVDYKEVIRYYLSKSVFFCSVRQPIF